MRGDLGRLEGDMKGLRDNQLFCNEGILTLCSSLREIISGGQKSKYTSVATLDSFINRSKHMPLPQHAVRARLRPLGLCSLPHLSPPPLSSLPKLLPRVHAFRPRTSSTMLPSNQSLPDASLEALAEPLFA